jgi:hypothetical protein
MSLGRAVLAEGGHGGKAPNGGIAAWETLHLPEAGLI